MSKLCYDENVQKILELCVADPEVGVDVTLMDEFFLFDYYVFLREYIHKFVNDPRKTFDVKLKMQRPNQI